MVKDKNEFDDVLGSGGTGDGDEPTDRFEAPEGIWMRGLLMLVFVMLSKLAMTIIGVMALVQFLWMLFAKEKNALLVGFGEDLANWLADATNFLAGATEDKPFPWAKWG